MNDNKISINSETLGANPESLSFGEPPSLEVFDPISQRPRPRWAVEAVDELLVKIRHKNIWEIVDYCFKVWSKRFPQEEKEFYKELKEYRKNRANDTASTKSKTYRELLIVPPLVWYLLNKIAAEKIRDYGEDKFKRDFSKRYSRIRPGEKF